jgi:uncharacterized protein (TIGR02265 family)
MTKQANLDGNDIKVVLTGNAVDQHPTLLNDLLAKFGYDFYNPPVRVTFDIYLKILELIRQECYPKLPEYNAYFVMGRKSVEGYRKELIGRVTQNIAKIASPEERARIYVENFATINRNSSEWKIEEVRAGYCRVRSIGGRVPPDFIRGVLYEGINLDDIINLKVTANVLSVDERIYEITWDKL